MLRGIIFPIFNGQIREALVQWDKPHATAPNEKFSIHPIVDYPSHTKKTHGSSDSTFFLCYGIKCFELISNRPWLRTNGEPSGVRPAYRLVFGKIENPAYMAELIRAVDEWVVRNIDI